MRKSPAAAVVETAMASVQHWSGVSRLERTAGEVGAMSAANRSSRVLSGAERGVAQPLPQAFARCVAVARDAALERQATAMRRQCACARDGSTGRCASNRGTPQHAAPKPDCCRVPGSHRVAQWCHRRVVGVGYVRVEKAARVPADPYAANAERGRYRYAQTASPKLDSNQRRPARAATQSIAAGAPEYPGIARPTRVQVNAGCDGPDHRASCAAFYL